MIANIFALFVLLLLVALFGWLAKRAWRSQHVILKWLAILLTGLLTLVLTIAFVVELIGVLKISLPPSNPVANVKVSGTAEQIARGAKFANFCAGCHSTTGKLPLNGAARNFGDIPNGPSLGTIYPPNLTPVGELKDWSDGEIMRAIREGVHRTGRPLVVMPSENLRNLSDADVQAVVAYLRSQPAVKNTPNTDTPLNGLNPLGAAFIGIGMFSTSVQPPITQPIPAPPPGANADNGQYIVSVLDCRTCHGKDLAGGSPNGLGIPVGPNLTVLVPKWTETNFMQVFRSGVDPSGRALNPEQMPFREIGAFASDEDLRGMYMYLRTLTPIDKSK